MACCIPEPSKKVIFRIKPDSVYLTHFTWAHQVEKIVYLLYGKFSAVLCFLHQTGAPLGYLVEPTYCQIGDGGRFLLSGNQIDCDQRCLGDTLADTILGEGSSWPKLHLGTSMELHRQYNKDDDVGFTDDGICVCKWQKRVQTRNINSRSMYWSMLVCGTLPPFLGRWSVAVKSDRLSMCKFLR